jgi:hypothetical protein
VFYKVWAISSQSHSSHLLRVQADVSLMMPATVPVFHTMHAIALVIAPVIVHVFVTALVTVRAIVPVYLAVSGNQ